MTSVFNESYNERIGQPTSNDEVRGHLLFTIGILAGLVGMTLFLFSQSATALREASIIVSAAGLSLMVAGPIIRLPLRRMATTLVYAGMLACTAAIVWFSMVFPQAWSVATGAQGVLLLYGAGIAIMAVGGIFVPLVTSRPQAGDVMAAQKKTKKAEKEKRQAEKETKQAEERAAQARETAAEATEERRDDDAEQARLHAALVGAREDEADLAAELVALRASRSRFEVFKSGGNGDGEWSWRLRHEDGEVLADDGGADYGTRHEAQDGVARVRREALGATLFHLRADEVGSEEVAVIEPMDDPETSQGTFELYEGASGNWRWRLRHDDGAVLADGGESFASKSNARRAVLSVQETAGPADSLTFDPTGFQVYRDKAGEWRWRLVHRNGNILADGGQGYSSRSNADRAVDRIQDDPSSLDVEIYEDKAGEYRWRMTAQNGRIVGDGGQGYDSKSNARRAVDGLGKHAANADTLEIGLAALEIFEHDGGGHQWRLRHRNGNILARGEDEGFGTRAKARDSIASFKRHAPGAEIETA